MSAFDVTAQLAITSLVLPIDAITIASNIGAAPECAGRF